MLFVISALEGDVKALCKAVTKVVGCTTLKGNAVVHHRFDCICFLSTGKLFFLCLSADNSRDSQGFLVEIRINLEHSKGFFPCLLLSFVHCMTLLPQKLACTQEWTGSFLPSHNRAPLVIKLWQISVCFNNFAVMLAKQGFGCWANTKSFVKLFVTANSYPSTFRGKALNMVLFLLEQAFGNKHRHINIFVTCFLKSSVKVSLDILPDSITVWTNNHTSLNTAIINKLCLFYNVGVPLCKVLVTACNGRNKLFVISHFHKPLSSLLRIVFIIQKTYCFFKYNHKIGGKHLIFAKRKEGRKTDPLLINQIYLKN